MLFRQIEQDRWDRFRSHQRGLGALVSHVTVGAEEAHVSREAVGDSGGAAEVVEAAHQAFH